MKGQLNAVFEGNMKLELIQSMVMEEVLAFPVISVPSPKSVEKTGDFVRTGDNPKKNLTVRTVDA